VSGLPTMEHVELSSPSLAISGGNAGPSFGGNPPSSEIP
jgi:hypothetical protein